MDSGNKKENIYCVILLNQRLESYLKLFLGLPHSIVTIVVKS